MGFNIYAPVIQLRSGNNGTFAFTGAYRLNGKVKPSQTATARRIERDGWSAEIEVI